MNILVAHLNTLSHEVQHLSIELTPKHVGHHTARTISHAKDTHSGRNSTTIMVSIQRHQRKVRPRTVPMENEVGAISHILRPHSSTNMMSF